MRWPPISRNSGGAGAAHGSIEIDGAAPGACLKTGCVQPLACLFSLFAARFSSSVLVGFFFSSFFRSIPLPMTRSSLGQLDKYQFLVLRRLNILRSPCRPVESRGGLGGFSPTRLMRSSR